MEIFLKIVHAFPRDASGRINDETLVLSEWRYSHYLSILYGSGYTPSDMLPPWYPRCSALAPTPANAFVGTLLLSGIAICCRLLGFNNTSGALACATTVWSTITSHCHNSCRCNGPTQSHKNGGRNGRKPIEIRLLTSSGKTGPVSTLDGRG
jgi:hypothetical protein